MRACSSVSLCVCVDVFGCVFCSYVYDPANPVPSTGGNNLNIKCGPLDQTPVESRSDVIIYTSAAVTENVAVTGPLIVRSRARITRA